MTTAITIGAIITGLILYRILSKKSEEKKQTAPLIAKLLTAEFVQKYNNKQGQIKGGCLCFYGYWFGRPYDNNHKLELATFDSSTNILTLTFNQKETLSIFNPQDISEFKDKLVIGSADKIYWEWFSYGKPQTAENLYFIEINRKENSLFSNSNIDQYKPDFKNNPALLWT